MELKDLIRETLTGLSEGINESKKALNGKGMLICAPVPPVFRDKFDFQIDSNGRYCQKIEYDLAITVATGSTIDGKIEGKAGISVLGAEANFSSSSNTNNATISRLKFYIPVALECTNLKNTEVATDELTHCSE